MYLVSVVHAGEVPVTPDEASAWQRLCPLSTDQLAPVPALAGHLDRPEVHRRLAAADATRCPPDDVLAELRDLGVTAVFDPDTATAVHVNALNAVAARHSGSLAITLGVNALALLPLYVAGTPSSADGPAPCCGGAGPPPCSSPNSTTAATSLGPAPAPSRSPAATG